MLAKLLNKLDKLNAIFIKRLDEVGDIKQTFNQQWSNQNKRSCSTYHSFNVFFIILITISLQLVASYSKSPVMPQFVIIALIRNTCPNL